MQPKSIEGLILTLLAEGVEFVVIGGMAGVLHGAPIVTKDLDIVHHRTPENVARLLARSEVMPFGDAPVRVVDLPTLIELKTKAGRPKDRLTLPTLIATLEERTRNQG